MDEKVSEKCPEHIAPDLRTLISLLQDPRRCHQWTTAARIATLTLGSCRNNRGWNRRYVALLSKYSDGRIISTKEGYKLQDFSTPDEIKLCYVELADMAKSIGERATAIMRWFHQHKDAPIEADSRQQTLF